MHVFDKESGTLQVECMEEEGMRGLEAAKEYALHYHGAYDGLISAVMVPERIELQTETVLKETKAFAKEQGLILRLHAAQSDFEYDYIQRKYGKSPVQYMDDIGILDEQTLIPHAMYVSGYAQLPDKSNRDMELLKTRGVSVIHCPLICARTGNILDDFGKYRSFGLNVCMGSDTFAPDFFEMIRIARAMAFATGGNHPSHYFKEFFEAATLGGAKALGREDLGKLSVGAKADFIVIDMNSFLMGVTDDPIRTMCMYAKGSDVKYSVINGREVLINGKIPGLDYSLLQQKAQSYYEKMKNSFVERSAFAKEGFFTTSYPMIQK